mmetsp:Transcript_59387/g.184240  ORF Transcript_59387/g.184240 Transcript_59387/m.184240 type:complete len:251 (+) Transcript_59387:1-753(+)
MRPHAELVKICWSGLGLLEWAAGAGAKSRGGCRSGRLAHDDSDHRTRSRGHPCEDARETRHGPPVREVSQLRGVVRTATPSAAAGAPVQPRGGGRGHHHGAHPTAVPAPTAAHGSPGPPAVPLPRSPLPAVAAAAPAAPGAAPCAAPPSPSRWPVGCSSHRTITCGEPLLPTSTMVASKLNPAPLASLCTRAPTSSPSLYRSTRSAMPGFAGNCAGSMRTKSAPRWLNHSRLKPCSTWCTEPSQWKVLFL